MQTSLEPGDQPAVACRQHEADAARARARIAFRRLPDGSGEWPEPLMSTNQTAWSRPTRRVLHRAPRRPARRTRCCSSRLISSSRRRPSSCARCTCAASSDARNRTIAVTCTGSTRCLEALLREDLGFFFRRVPELHLAGCTDGTRHHAVDADVRFAEVARQRACHALDAGLGRFVDRQVAAGASARTPSRD